MVSTAGISREVKPWPVVSTGRTNNTHNHREREETENCPRRLFNGSKKSWMARDFTPAHCWEGAPGQLYDWWYDPGLIQFLSRESVGPFQSSGDAGSPQKWPRLAHSARLQTIPSFVRILVLLRGNTQRDFISRLDTRTALSRVCYVVPKVILLQ